MSKSRRNNRRQNRTRKERRKQKQMIAGKNTKYSESFSKFVAKVSDKAQSKVTRDAFGMEKKPDKGVRMHAPTHNLFCHETTKVMDIGKCRIYGGRQAQVLRQNWDLVIQMVDSISQWREDVGDLVKANSAARAMVPSNLLRMCYYPHINITWDDFEVPGLPVSWWNNLVKWMQERPAETSIAICCVGGHGRTGTFLSVLAGLSGQTGYERCPISWVRARYCDNAVESAAQIAYVERVTGLKTNATRPSLWYEDRYGADYWQRFHTGQQNKLDTGALCEYDQTSGNVTYYPDPYDNSRANDSPPDHERDQGLQTTGVFRPVTNAAGDVVSWEKDYRHEENVPDNPKKNINYSYPDEEDFSDPEFDWDFYIEKTNQLVDAFEKKQQQIAKEDLND